MTDTPPPPPLQRTQTSQIRGPGSARYHCVVLYVGIGRCEECGLTQPVLSRTRIRIGVHLGSSLNMGHYVAYVRGQGDTWVRAADTRITEVGTKPKLLQEAEEMRDCLSCRPTCGSVLNKLPGDRMFIPRTVAPYAPRRGPNQVRLLMLPSRFLGVFGRFARVDPAANVVDPPPPPRSRGRLCYCETSVGGESWHFVVRTCRAEKV